MEFISEEEIAKEVKKTLEKVLWDSINNITQTAIREELKKIVSNSLDVQAIKDILKQEIDTRVGIVAKQADEYFTTTVGKTRISKCVWEYIDTHWFIPTSLSPVEKDVIVKDVIASVEWNLWNMVQTKIDTDLTIQQSISYNVAQAQTGMDIRNVILKLNKYWYFNEAIKLQNDIDCWVLPVINSANTSY